MEKERRLSYRNGQGIRKQYYYKEQNLQKDSTLGKGKLLRLKEMLRRYSMHP